MDDLNSPLGETFKENFANSPLYKMKQSVVKASPFGEKSELHENRCGEFDTEPRQVYTQFHKLVETLSKGINDSNFLFDSESYIGKVNVTKARNDVEEYGKTIGEHPAFEYETVDGAKAIGTVFSVKLNSRKCYLEPNIGYRIKVDPSSNRLMFVVLVYYADTKKYRREALDTIDEKDFRLESKYVAVQIETQDARLFEDIIIRFSGKKSIKSAIKDKFDTVFHSISTASDYNWFYSVAPEYVIDDIGKHLLWDHLVIILDHDAEGWFSWFKDSSNAMLNIVKAFCKTEQGIAHLYRQFDNDQVKVKSIYEHLQGNSKYEGQELPNKTIFAALITALTDLQVTTILNSQSSNSKHSRDRTHIVYRLTKGYRVDSNIASADESSDTFVLTQQQQYTEERTDTIYPSGGSGGATVTYDHVEWRNGQEYSLHPMDIIMVEMVGLFGFTMTVPLPAIYVKDIAHHEEWGRVMHGIRIAANLLMIVVSVTTILSGAGLLLTTLAWIDLGLALGDITIQAFESELRKTEWGRKFLEIWDEIYTVGSFVTVAPMLGNLLVNGAKAFTRALSKAAQLRLGNMLEFAIFQSQKFNNFLVAGQFKVIYNYSTFATDIAHKLTVLRAEGILMLQEVKALGAKVSDQIGEKFHLIYWDTIIYTAESLNDLKAFLSRVVKNEKIVFKEIEEFSLEQFYKKGYDYVKMGMPSKNIIKAMFGRRGQKLVSVVDREVGKLKKMIDPETGKVISGNKLRERVLVAGITCRKYTTKIFHHTNYPKRLIEAYLETNNLSRGAFELADIKDFYRHLKKVGFIDNEMHPLLEARIKKYLKRAQGGIKHSDNYSLNQTGGIPGVHAEILSINEMLWKLESIGVNLDARIFTEMIGFNKAIVPGNVMIRCLDCHFISFRVPFIEKIIP